MIIFKQTACLSCRNEWLILRLQEPDRVNVNGNDDAKLKPSNEVQPVDLFAELIDDCGPVLVYDYLY
jgi:hypothetical protein